jgi:hypothetical protein
VEDLWKIKEHYLGNLVKLSRGLEIKDKKYLKNLPVENLQGTQIATVRIKRKRND